MKALTIWQPWASLIAIGAKPYEFRTWEAPKWIIGQRIAIHAGARPIKKEEVGDLVYRLDTKVGVNPCLTTALALPFLEKVLMGLRLPLSCIVATAVVGQPLRGDLCANEFGRDYGNDSNRENTFNWGWPLLDIKPLIPPAEAKGAQGFWHWNEREAA